MAEKQERFEKDLKTTKKFFQFIEEGFQKEWNDSWKTLNAGKNPVEKVLHLCSTCLLAEEFSKLESHYHLEA